MRQLFSGLIKTTLISAIAVVVISCGGAEERKVKYLEKGKAYIEEQNYDKAKIEIKNVLQIDPKFAEAHYVMGLINEQEKEYRKAMGNYLRTIELDPEHISAKINLARIYVLAGTDEMVEKARQNIREVKKAEPDNIEADLLSAIIDYKSGLKEQGIEKLEAVVAKDKQMVEALSLLANAYLSEGNEEKAINLLREGAKNNPQAVPLRITLARIAAKNNDLAEAEANMKQAIEVEPENFELKVLLSGLYVKFGQLKKAENLIASAIQQDDEDLRRYLVMINMLSSQASVERAESQLKKYIKDKPDLYGLRFTLAEFYEKTGQMAKSKQTLQQIINDRSFDIEGVKARNVLANILLGEGDFDAAKKLVDEVLVEYPSNNEALMVNGKIALNNLDSITAINDLRTVVKNEPKNAEAAFMLAQAHEINGESELAENELKKAIEANPVNDNAHANYATYVASKGRIDEALSIVDKALAYFKDSYELMNLKLKILVSQNKRAESLALMEAMEQVSANNAEVNINKGKYYLSNGDVVSAIAEFEKAYKKAPSKYESLELIVKTYMSNSQMDKAIARIDKRFEVDANDAIAHQLMGEVHLAKKDTKQALTSFTNAADAAKTWIKPYLRIAAIHVFEKNYQAAIDVLNNAQNKVVNKTPLQLQIAAIYEYQEKYQDAMKVYEAVLSGASSNKMAANNYAALLLDYGTSAADTAKALELSRNFEKVQQPALQDTLAWAYAKSGDYQKAIDILKPIVERASNVAVFRYHLGYALYHSGDKAAAKSHLEIAVDSEQDFPGKIEAEALLKEI